jgi:hypothetical protein
MDETPEELEQIRREAEQIDPYQYRRRGRLMAAVALGALGAGLFWGVLALLDSRRNPCERLRNHLCQNPGTTDCHLYDGIFKESVEDPSPQMRSVVRAQCETKIRRLKEENGVDLK